ncbi:MAG: glycosyltransferase family 4 protein [Chloroflexota bacterium]|nr:glycosyltransferase family 4 protein [Chloroflexota bacterium]
MKVAIDFTAGVRQPAGVGRYTRSLVKALCALPGVPHELLLLWAGPARIPPPVDWPHTRTRRLPLPERWMTVAWQRARLPLPADLLAGGADVFYSPDFALPPLWRARSLVTVHDLSYLTHPETHYPPLRDFLTQVVPRSVRRADLVLADSQQTKHDLVHLLHAPEAKIEVVHAAADPVFRRVEDAGGVAEVLRRRGIDRPYILTVGTIQPRKNLPIVFDALRRLHERGHNLLLIHVGRPGWLYEPVFQALEDSGVKSAVRFLAGVDDLELATLYTGAIAHVFPSLYEGFGITCLEAMACGTPVIASHAGSLAEVVGDAAVAVQPEDACAIASGVVRLLDSSPFRDALIQRGYAQTARFSWDASAQRLRHFLEG